MYLRSGVGDVAISAESARVRVLAVDDEPERALLLLREGERWQVEGVYD